MPGEQAPAAAPGGAFRLLAVWLTLCGHCLAGSQDVSLPYKVGDSVEPSKRNVSFTECHPQAGRTHQLSDFDYHQNGGQKYITVIATYDTGCGISRQELPDFSKYADEYASQAAVKPSGSPKVAFMASLKVGLGTVCSSWATLDNQNSPDLFVIDDQSQSLHHLFFSTKRPMYVVLDQCQRVRAYLCEGEMAVGLKPTLDGLLANASALDDSCPRLPNATQALVLPQHQPSAPPPEAADAGPVLVSQLVAEPKVLTYGDGELPQGPASATGLLWAVTAMELATVQEAVDANKLTSGGGNAATVGRSNTNVEAEGVAVSRSSDAESWSMMAEGFEAIATLIVAGIFAAAFITYLPHTTVHCSS